MTYTNKYVITLRLKDNNEEQLCISCGKLFQIDIMWGKKESVYALVWQMGLSNWIFLEFLKFKDKFRRTSGALVYTKEPFKIWNKKMKSFK